MASGFFAILDDVAALLDDVAAMSKIATKKTAGILGDDLAVNAEKASGFVSKRELPVLWAITKGSLLNKIIILPIAFLLSAFLPWAVTVILVLGGVYLAFEGAEKIYSYRFYFKYRNCYHCFGYGNKRTFGESNCCSVCCGIISNSGCLWYCSAYCTNG